LAVENPSKRMKPVKVSPKPTDYFTPEEFSKIIDGTYAYGNWRGGRDFEHRPLRLRTLIFLMRWSGLSILDPVTLERRRLEGNRLFLYRHKTGVPGPSRHGFAVTISLDGSREMHDRLRPFKDGRGSYERTMDRVRPLLQRQRQMQVSARVTVTPQNLSLRKTLDDFISIGFHSVGFSPMLSSPGSAQEMSSADLQKMLQEMLECGAEFERRVGFGDRYPFLNMSNALREIHKGTHRPYPCGAGAGYLGVSADGGLYACHRFVGDEGGKMGDLNNGIDREKRNGWLAARHVHFQSPCHECWARYLCGGGCHHEVLQRGRPACDYIRGWLEYCLQAYIRLLEKRPEYFTS
jgi:uncharacterized protein